MVRYEDVVRPPLLRAVAHNLSPIELRLERRRARVSRYQLAQMLGVALVTVDRWEAGHTPVNRSRALAITVALGRAMADQDAWDAECAPKPGDTWRVRVFKYFARHDPREPAVKRADTG